MLKRRPRRGGFNTLMKAIASRHCALARSPLLLLPLLPRPQ
ncbi:hypothetical protein [Aetokthonos hydrillicola]|nr:hypothetical protein [Aetokthonos hydrillicola]